MSKPDLLYASPLPPMKSGISDYSEILIHGLKDYFNITIMIDNYKLSNKQLYRDFKVVDCSKKKINAGNYDFRIYNIGNNHLFHSYLYKDCLEYPGLIILHDYILYNFIVGHYFKRNNFYSKLYELGNAEGFHILKTYIKRKNLHSGHEVYHLLPLNKEILLSDNLIMTHSFYVYDRIAEVVKNKERIRKINLVTMARHEKPMQKEILFARYNIPANSFIISSLGSIQYNKLNHIVCDVVTRINRHSSNNVIYMMIGEGTYVDAYLNGNIIKTGYTSMEEFNSFIHYSDLIVNLRYPTMGETSGSLIHGMGLGKACIVTNIGWYSELPDEYVIKIDHNENMQNELYNTITYLLENQDALHEIGSKAKTYIEQTHDVAKISKEIYSFMMGDINRVNQ